MKQDDILVSIALFWRETDNNLRFNQMAPKKTVFKQFECFSLEQFNSWVQKIQSELTTDFNNYSFKAEIVFEPQNGYWYKKNQSCDCCWNLNPMECLTLQDFIRLGPQIEQFYKTLIVLLNK